MIVGIFALMIWNRYLKNLDSSESADGGCDEA